MNDYPTKCSVTRAYMPTNASLLQFRQHFVRGRDGSASSGKGVLLPDFMPKMIGVNQYVDRLTGERYGASHVRFCYARMEAIRSMNDIHTSQGLNRYQLVGFEL